MAIAITNIRWSFHMLLTTIWSSVELEGFEPKRCLGKAKRSNTSIGGQSHLPFEANKTRSEIPVQLCNELCCAMLKRRPQCLHPLRLTRRQASLRKKDGAWESNQNRISFGFLKVFSGTYMQWQGCEHVEVVDGSFLMSSSCWVVTFWSCRAAVKFKPPWTINMHAHDWQLLCLFILVLVLGKRSSLG